MNVKMDKAMVPETPASCMTEYVMEHITALMTIGGIESISAQKYVCGFGEKLHVTIAPFANAPKKIRDQGVIIKDAIAQIMSVANVSRVLIEPSDEDMKSISEMWKSSVRGADSLNKGSGQDFSGDSSGDDESEED